MNAKLFCIIVGISAFVVAFVLGSAVTITTGIPLAGGLLNGVLTSMVLTIGMLGVQRTFAWPATVMWLVFSAAAIVTTTLGPPGIYKVLIGLAAGFTWDVVYRISGYRRTGLYIGAILGGLVLTAALIGLLYLIINGIAAFLATSADYQSSLDRLKSYLQFLIPINVVVTALGVWLGTIVYERRLKTVITVR